MCKSSYTQIIEIKSGFEEISLSEQQKKLIISRYISLLHEYRNRMYRYSVAFHTLRVIMSVGSLIVPALLSIQNTSSTAQIQAQVYWIVWTLSLFVTISNGIMTLVKVDKKYYVFNTIYHHLMSEGWQYIQLSGKYSETKTNEQSSHINQYAAFCHSLEKIRMKQVEDEYYKVENNHPTQQSEIVPPTPFRKSMVQVNGFHPTTVQKMGDKTEEYEI